MEEPVEVIVAVIVGVALGAVVVWFAQEVRAKARVATLEGRLSEAKTGEQLLETAKEQLRESFEATASRIAANNNEAFLQLANENLGKTMEAAKGDLENRHKQFQELVKPLAENYQNLNPKIDAWTKQASELTTETSKLASALTSSTQIGSWGEIELQRVVELAGLNEHIDYSLQATVESGSDRPDMTVRLPDGRAVVIDAKASAKAFLEASEAEDEAAENAALTRHADALKTQVDGLAARKYGDKVDGSLDFVVMFVPGDQFLAAALRSNPNLVTYAMAKRVAIATPASLISLLWAVAHGWQQHHLAEHASEIAKAGDDLFRRLQTFINHYDSVGKGLERALKAYDSSIGSFDRSIVPKGREFAGLLGKGEEDFPTPYTIDAPQVRSSRYVEPEALGMPESESDDEEEVA